MRFQIYIEFTKNMYSICKYFAKIRKYKILNAECRQMNGGEGGGKKRALYTNYRAKSNTNE